MKILLHACCGPCAIYPLSRLTQDALDFKLWFYNPNIQPKGEFFRRRDSLAYLAAHLGLTVDFSPSYEPDLFLETVKNDLSAPNRCRLCFRLRFEKAALTAARRGFSHFSTTLLYSRRQNHELIIEEGLKAAAYAGIAFYYQDFRPGWKTGIDISRELGLYRQNYCGCFYSQL